MATMKNVSDGIAYINATFNNTIVTLADQQGNTIAWASAGESYSGSRQSTPFAAQETGRVAAERALKVSKLESLDVIVKGPGPGRESAIRALAAAGFNIKSITDMSSIPFNGCRDPKERRI
jgi:small subunit ribosomal protein S11